MAVINILIVDDDTQIVNGWESLIKDNFQNIEVFKAYDGKQAIKILNDENCNLIISDLKMPNMDGMELLRKSKELNPDSVFIMITAYGTVKSAVETMKSGAHNYISKPISNDDFILKVKNAIDTVKIKTDLYRLRKSIASKYQIIGKSREIKEVLTNINKVSQADITVLITGKSGTGKELVAKAMHHNSNRANQPFVDVNCAAIPKELIESELLGHEKGSFTGANEQKKGKFELADGGTLFLDEIGDMALETQAKILKVLEGQKFQRVGGTKDIKVDVRIIAATNKNLEEEITKGAFREDLFYRINVFPIHIPPLRERKEDIPSLVNHFIKTMSAKNKKTVNSISQDALSKLMEYDFPGNIRELENLIERAVILCDNNIIQPKHIILSESKTHHVSPVTTTPTPDYNSIISEAKEAFNRHGGSDSHILKKLIEIIIKTCSTSELHNRLSTISLTKILSTSKDKINRAVRDSEGGLVYAVLKGDRIQKCEDKNKPKNCFIYLQNKIS